MVIAEALCLGGRGAEWVIVTIGVDEAGGTYAFRRVVELLLRMIGFITSVGRACIPQLREFCRLVDRK